MSQLIMFSRGLLAPLLLPRVHLLDLSSLRGNDRFGELFDLGMLGFLERFLGHLDRSFVVRNHAVEEREVDFGGCRVLWLPLRHGHAWHVHVERAWLPGIPRLPP